MSTRSLYSMMKRTEPTRTYRARRAAVCCALAVISFPLLRGTARGATYTSANFAVTADSQKLAEHVAQIAEEHREACAQEFLAGPLPVWETPCRITVTIRQSESKGWTSYEIYRGKIENLRIRVSGRREHILDYLVPHEVAHAVLAVALGRPVPRWADEGLALLRETETQLARQRSVAAQLASADALMPLSELLQVREYPADRDRMLDFYASSFSLAEFLVSRGGAARLVKLLREGNRKGCENSIRDYYGYSDGKELEADWIAWATRAGAGQVATEDSRESGRSAGGDAGLANNAEPTSALVAATEDPRPAGVEAASSGAASTRNGRSVVPESSALLRSP